jgi:hypothetical protein
MERKSLERRHPTMTRTTKSPQTHHHSPPITTSTQTKTHNVVALKNKESEEVHPTERRTSHDDVILTPSDERKEKVDFGAKQQIQLKKIGKIITFSSIGILYILNFLFPHSQFFTRFQTRSFLLYIALRILKIEILSL